MKKEAKFKRRTNSRSDNKRRKAVSPIVSTILLIMIVVIIAIIILLWARNFIKEAILKEIAGNTKKVEAWCSQVQLKPIMNEDGSCGIANEGNIPIHAIDLKTSDSEGSSNTEHIGPLDINAGYSKIIPGCDTNAYESIKIIPIILGKRKSGLVEPYTCPEKDAVIVKDIEN